MALLELGNVVLMVGGLSVALAVIRVASFALVCSLGLVKGKLD